jgi:3-hydroxybutyryl-CoA dehydratase
MTGRRVGDVGPTFEIGPITREDILCYAAASGDGNPIHQSDEFARSAGLPSVMAHGMLSAGLLASFVTHWFGADSVRQFKVRFCERVWPGDRLRAQGRIVRLFEASSESRAELELALGRPDGTPVITGTAQVIVS